jgi:hypothetical protein
MQYYVCTCDVGQLELCPTHYAHYDSTYNLKVKTKLCCTIFIRYHS